MSVSSAPHARAARPSWPRPSECSRASPACASPRSAPAPPRSSTAWPRHNSTARRCSRSPVRWRRHASRPSPHQVVDHDRLYAPITKWAGRMEAGAAATVMRKALRTATAERPGAVHLTIGGELADARRSTSRGLPRPRAPAAAPVSRTGAAAPAGPRRRPVVLAGIGGRARRRRSALVALAEDARCPSSSRRWPRACSRDDHPWYAGVLDMACNQVVWHSWPPAT